MVHGSVSVEGCRVSTGSPVPVRPSSDQCLCVKTISGLKKRMVPRNWKWSKVDTVFLKMVRGGRVEDVLRTSTIIFTAFSRLSCGWFWPHRVDKPIHLSAAHSTHQTFPMTYLPSSTSISYCHLLQWSLVWLGSPTILSIVTRLLLVPLKCNDFYWLNSVRFDDLQQSLIIHSTPLNKLDVLSKLTRLQYNKAGVTEHQEHWR